LRTWEAGRDLVLRTEDPAPEVEPQEVLDQIEDYRTLFETPSSPSEFPLKPRRT
jgi:hypothetical protein